MKKFVGIVCETRRPPHSSRPKIAVARGNDETLSTVFRF